MPDPSVSWAFSYVTFFTTILWETSCYYLHFLVEIPEIKGIKKFVPRSHLVSSRAGLWTQAVLTPTAHVLSYFAVPPFLCNLFLYNWCKVGTSFKFIKAFFGQVFQIWMRKIAEFNVCANHDHRFMTIPPGLHCPELVWPRQQCPLNLFLHWALSGLVMNVLD